MFFITFLIPNDTIIKNFGTILFIHSIFMRLKRDLRGFYSRDARHTRFFKLSTKTYEFFILVWIGSAKTYEVLHVIIEDLRLF